MDKVGCFTGNLSGSLLIHSRRARSGSLLSPFPAERALRDEKGTGGNRHERFLGDDIFPVIHASCRFPSFTSMLPHSSASGHSLML